MSAPTKRDEAMKNAEVKCPVNLDDVDLFAPGSQEYWFDAYRILHRDAPVLRSPSTSTSASRWRRSAATPRTT